jgi:hypothetical protein
VIERLLKSYFGGTVWESNPPDLARRSQAVLKTVEDTSTPFSPTIIIVKRQLPFVIIIQWNIVIINRIGDFVIFPTTFALLLKPDLSFAIKVITCLFTI